MENINLILPEIMLFLGICLALMIGVFLKIVFLLVMKIINFNFIRSYLFNLNRLGRRTKNIFRLIQK